MCFTYYSIIFYRCLMIMNSVEVRNVEKYGDYYRFFLILLVIASDSQVGLFASEDIISDHREPQLENYKCRAAYKIQ